MRLIPPAPDEILPHRMAQNPEEKGSIGVGPLVLALAKTFHWAGLYGPDHPVLAKRVGELHAALLSHLPLEPGGQLLLGIARDRVLYRNEFLGEGQDLVARLTESLYIRQVATMGLDESVTPHGILALFRFLHATPAGGVAVPPEQFLRENGIRGMSLSPHNYRELLSRKLVEAEGTPGRDKGREEELWRLLLTADSEEGSEERNVLEELSESPEILQAILRRAHEIGRGGAQPVTGDDGPSIDVLKRIFGRIGALMRMLPDVRKQEILLSLEAGADRPDQSGDSPVGYLELLEARSFTENFSDDEFLDLLASLLSAEGKGGERLRSAFGIIAAERDVPGSLLPRAGERMKESRRVKDYYSLKTWEMVEKLLLSRSEERYVGSDHARFLEDISALRGSYLPRLEEKSPLAPAFLEAFHPEGMRRKTILILLELLRTDKLEGEFFDILEEIRKTLPNLVSRKETDLLDIILLSLESAAGSVREEWKSAVREVLLGVDFDQIIDFAVSGDPGNRDAVLRILARFGNASAQTFLDRLLNEPEAAKRRELLKLAVTLGPAAVPAILERMGHPKWYFVRNLCIILGELGDRRASNSLVQAVSHPDHRVRREAIHAIGKLEAPEAISVLGKILVEESFFAAKKDDQLRIDAASALYRIGGTEAIGYLHQAKGSRRKAVRSHCTELLHSLQEAR